MSFRILGIYLFFNIFIIGQNIIYKSIFKLPTPGEKNVHLIRNFKSYGNKFTFYLDLWFRFSRSNLRYFRKIKNNRFLLPVLDNMHMTRNFLQFSGLKMLVGSRNMLPMFISRSGVFSSFLITNQKTSF